MENQRAPSVLYEPGTCAECGSKGTKGRMAITEVVPIDEKLREAIVQRASHDELRKLVTAAGVLTMRQEGILQALAGVVSLEEVLEATSED